MKNKFFHSSFQFQIGFTALFGFAILACLMTGKTSFAQGQVSPYTSPPGVSLNQPLVAQPPVPARQMQAAIRIKDITTIEGHHSNIVTGMGLVTGLKGTGSKSELTQELMRNMLKRFDILAGANMPTGSVALVAVTAEIPPFVRPGETVKATVSVVDASESLYGGILHETPLKAVDDQVYALGKGAVILSGFSASGDAGGVAKNHDTAGKVEAEIVVGIHNEPAFPNNRFALLLTNKDYATAHRIAQQINTLFPGYAKPRDQGGVEVQFPPEYLHRKLEFVVKINELRVIPDIPARVVINQKSGAIIIGQNVKLSNVMFANENLVISTSETPVASQPAPFSAGETAILPRTQITASETGGNYNMLQQQTTVGELASVLNSLGIPPRELISIFQTIEASGSLQAQLIIE